MIRPLDFSRFRYSYYGFRYLNYVEDKKKEWFVAAPFFGEHIEIWRANDD